MIFNPFVMDGFKSYMKFCSNCGKKLNLPFKDFHLPLCLMCREKIINEILKDNWESGLNKKYKVVKL